MIDDGKKEPTYPSPLSLADWEEYRANRKAWLLGWNGVGGPEARDRYCRKARRDEFWEKWGPRIIWVLALISLLQFFGGGSSDSSCSTRASEWQCDDRDSE